MIAITTTMATIIPTAAPTVRPQQMFVLVSQAAKNISEAVAVLHSEIFYEVVTQSATPHFELAGLKFYKSQGFKLLEWHGIFEISFLVTSTYSESPNSLKVSIVTSMPATPKIFLIDSSVQQMGIETVTILPKPKKSSQGSVQTGSSTEIPSEIQMQQLFMRVTSSELSESSTSYIIPLYLHASYFRMETSMPDPKPQVNMVISKVFRLSITSINPDDSSSPFVGLPSVKNKKISSALAQGAPNSSFQAEFSIENPSLNAASQFVIPLTDNQSISCINFSLCYMVALTILSDPRVYAVELNVITPMKSLLLSVLITLFAASLAKLILLPSIDPEISTISITFFPPDVAVTYQGLKRGSQSTHYYPYFCVNVGYVLIEPKVFPMQANPYCLFLPLSSSLNDGSSTADVHTKCL